MANDLIAAAAKRAELTISSPALRRLLALPLGTVQHPGQRPRKYLAGGLKLTSEQRADAMAAHANITAALDSATMPEAHDARLAIVTRMLLAYPVAGASAESGKARGGVYIDALDDLPPFALQAAVRAWGRGEGEGNHDFAPSPARLRTLALRDVERHRTAVAKLDDLLSAQTIDEAMDSTRDPAPVPALVAKLRRM